MYRHVCYWGPGDRVGGPAREGSEEGRKKGERKGLCSYDP